MSPTFWVRKRGVDIDMLGRCTKQSHEIQDFNCTLGFYALIDVTSKCIIVADIALVGEQQDFKTIEDFDFTPQVALTSSQLFPHT
jgi:hypothetical protein